MSDTTANPQSVAKSERTLGQEVARESTIALASSAAGIIGLVGGLMAITSIKDRRQAKKVGAHADRNTTESETTES